MRLLDTLDVLKLYRGDDFAIGPSITLSQPALGQICDYGEQKYYGMIHTLCSSGADLKWQLDDIGIDYTKISDYELFYSFLAPRFTAADTEILFGGTLDFSRMKLTRNQNTGETVMLQIPEDGTAILIDRYIYTLLAAVLRKMHGIKRNDEMPGNEATKAILIEDARDAYEESKKTPCQSILLPQISALVNSEGFKHDEQDVFNMKIYAFTDSVRRISKIKSADRLLQSGYSGFGINLKDIDKKELNWMGDLD